MMRCSLSSPLLSSSQLSSPLLSSTLLNSPHIFPHFTAPLQRCQHPAHEMAYLGGTEERNQEVAQTGRTQAGLWCVDTGDG